MKKLNRNMRKVLSMVFAITMAVSLFVGVGKISVQAADIYSYKKVASEEELKNAKFSLTPDKNAIFEDVLDRAVEDDVFVYEYDATYDMYMGYKCTAPGRLQSESIPTSLLSSYLRNYNLYAVEAEQGPIEKKATISEGTIEGVVGTELQDQGLTVTLEGDTFKSSGVMSFSAESWFTDLPEGITVVAIAPANGSAIAFTFKGTPTEVSNKEIKITIPAEELKGKEAIAVEVNPNAKFNIVSGAPENYVVTVTGGSADKTEYSKGETVTITANKPAEGKRFKNWTTSDGVIFASETSATTTFTMPEKAVTVVANYEDVPKTDDKPKAETPKSEEPKADETPKTGDMNSAVVWILIAGISGLGTMYLVRKGRNA